MHKPCDSHWSATKRVIRYLKGTEDYGIKYTKVYAFYLIENSNSYFNGDKENIVLTLGYLMSLGSIMVSYAGLHSMNLSHIMCIHGVLNDTPNLITY